MRPRALAVLRLITRWNFVLLDRQVSGPRALQDLVNEVAARRKLAGMLARTHEAAGLRVFSPRKAGKLCFAASPTMRVCAEGRSRRAVNEPLDALLRHAPGTLFEIVRLPYLDHD